MKTQREITEEKLAHALTFLRLAKDAKWPEMRKQHLDEAERLMEYVLGITKESHGEAKA